MPEARIKNLSKYSGAAAVLILWLAIPWGMHLIGLHLFDDKPISYLGVDPNTKLLFSSALTAAAILIIVFGVQVRRAFQASRSFLIFLTIGQVAQIITALVIDSGRMKPVHTIAAFAIAFSLPLLMWRFSVSETEGSLHKLARALFLAELVGFALGIGLFIFVGGTGPFGEILTVVFFHVWVLTITAHWPVQST